MPTTPEHAQRTRRYVEHAQQTRRSEAQRTLTRILAVAPEFGPDGADLHAQARDVRRRLDEIGTYYAAPTLCARAEELGDRLVDLEADRRERSETLPPEFAACVEIRLFGNGHDGYGQTGLSRAAELAAEWLSGPVSLVDSTPIRTAERVGTRYTFRTREDNA